MRFASCTLSSVLVQCNSAKRGNKKSLNEDAVYPDFHTLTAAILMLRFNCSISIILFYFLVIVF